VGLTASLDEEANRKSPPPLQIWELNHDGHIVFSLVMLIG